MFAAVCYVWPDGKNAISYVHVLSQTHAIVFALRQQSTGNTQLFSSNEQMARHHMTDVLSA